MDWSQILATAADVGAWCWRHWEVTALVGSWLLAVLFAFRWLIIFLLVQVTRPPRALWRLAFASAPPGRVAAEALAALDAPGASFQPAAGCTERAIAGKVRAGGMIFTIDVNGNAGVNFADGTGCSGYLTLREERLIWRRAAAVALACWRRDRAASEELIAEQVRYARTASLPAPAGQPNCLGNRALPAVPAAGNNGNS